MALLFCDNSIKACGRNKNKVIGIILKFLSIKGHEVFRGPFVDVIDTDGDIQVV